MLIIVEKDGECSQVVVDAARPVKIKYSKNLEMLTLSLSYGVPHYSFYHGRIL